MKKKKAEKWLKNTINDLFMNFLFYDRKQDEDMSVKKVRDLMDNETISKKMMIKAFIKQINKEY